MGGKKKSNKAVIKKDSKFKIPANFDCPLCDAKAAIKIRVNRRENVATVQCRHCKKPEPAFQTPMTRLSKPHDAFFEYFERVHAEDARMLAQHNVARAVAQGAPVVAGDIIARNSSSSSLPSDEGGLEESDNEVAGLLN